MSRQNEVSLLRNEVAHLKQLLLAHKDCPVTNLQKKTAYLGEVHLWRPLMFIFSFMIIQDKIFSW